MYLPVPHFPVRSFLVRPTYRTAVLFEVLLEVRNQLLHALDHFGILLGDVLRFADVGRDVVQLDRRALRGLRLDRLLLAFSPGAPAVQPTLL